MRSITRYTNGADPTCISTRYYHWWSNAGKRSENEDKITARRNLLSPILSGNRSMRRFCGRMVLFNNSGECNDNGNDALQNHKLEIDTANNMNERPQIMPINTLPFSITFYYFMSEQKKGNTSNLVLDRSLKKNLTLSTHSSLTLQ
ncbi:unnamed protein product [Rhizophagus irregularis]|nr:unnamed protein product [Rhizophagus irregularis]CAB5111556.1 unnamed protein product [Rhizophagus irregularis]